MKTAMKVYAARAYTPENPRMDRYIQINAPEHLPTIPNDDQETTTILQTSYFKNVNFPTNQQVIKNSHFLQLPLMQGTSCPSIFPKGTPFLLVCPTEKLEEGFLIYIETLE